MHQMRLTIKQRCLAAITEANYPIVKALQEAGWEVSERDSRDGYLSMNRLMTEPTLHIWDNRRIASGYEGSPHWRTLCSPNKNPMIKLKEHIKPVHQLFMEWQARKK